MSVDVFVCCSCYARRLTTALPVDAERLALDDFGQPRPGPDLTPLEAQSLAEWAKASCPHPDGMALQERLGSSRSIGTALAVLSPVVEICPTLVRELTTVAQIGVNGTEPLDCERLVVELRALAARGIPAAEAPQGADTLFALLLVLERAALVAVEQDQNLIWS